MADIMNPEERSKRMSLIRGKWTTPELKVHEYLKGRKIRHNMHPRMTGNPDIILKDKRVAVFIDGCFWHGCPRCYVKPMSNSKYWRNKIIINKKNASRANSSLKKKGWKVVRLMEHKIKEKDMNNIIDDIL